jgi:MoaA/NifB/PqqE/SkfB family radical SAM enzyme
VQPQVPHVHPASPYPEAARGLSWYQPDKELPLEAWTEFFEELTKWRPVVFITGGEPLLYGRILEFIEEAKKRHLVVHLQTNGLLLEQVADQVVGLGVEMVTVSLDGPPAIHDYIRGPGSFEKSARGLTALWTARRVQNSPGPVVDVRCTISKDNAASLGQMVWVAHELGVDLVQFTHTIFSSEALVERHNRLLSPKWAQAQGLTMISPSIPEGEYYQSEIGPETIPILLDSLREVKEWNAGTLKIRFSPNIPLSSVAPYYLDLDYPFPRVCKSLWRSCRILPDGTVSPCLHLVMGNITQQPLSEIWNGPGMQRLRKIISTRLLPGCARCCHRVFYLIWFVVFG